ncbi:hypothetical protein D3C81_1501050 [compost metagenome]
MAAAAARTALAMLATRSAMAGEFSSNHRLNRSSRGPILRSSAPSRRIAKFSKVVPRSRRAIMNSCASSVALSNPVFRDMDRYCCMNLAKSPLRMASSRFSSIPSVWPYWLANHVGFWASSLPRSARMSTVSRSSPLALRVCTPMVAK